MKKVIYLSFFLTLSNSCLEANQPLVSSKTPTIEVNKQQASETKNLSTALSTSPLMNCSANSNTPQCSTLNALVSALNTMSNSLLGNCSSCTPPNCDKFCTTLYSDITQLTNSQTLTEATFCSILNSICAAYGHQFGALANVCPPTPLPSICSTTQTHT